MVLFSIILAVLSPSHSYLNVGISLSVFEKKKKKNLLGFDRNAFKPIPKTVNNCLLINIDISNTWA